MKRLYVSLHLATTLVLGIAASAMAQATGPRNGKIYGSGNRALVVVLHGDVSKGGPATYHNDIAQKIARQNNGATVFALVRPGYAGSGGIKSPGSNNGRRDHYTKQNNALVAQTIQNLAKATGNSRVIGVGHSGGAAQLGAIAGMYPGLLDSVILVSCPCDIAAWRRARGKSAWRNSLSPHSYISRVARGTLIIAVVGTSDRNTFPKLSEDYVSAARARGLPAAYVPVSGAGHSFRGLQRTIENIVRSEFSK